ncbi:3,4-dihydroxy-2-butanone-4-phosphate synthase [Aphanomyces invadans]|uniref:3,4-dihydroxy-2-butanone 4-phosphate synthase n=1 Tax=Aphanomyces invadans TaxID=157072 RepID=A0A024TS00_9STRA|nr:3,4-dihydroxy-2-butanone-4-phosphate synthase [Aphanomyces invadans]ETV96137.1 3,4-dihydroxy-2-butanone-4-phosphate synthase [Aphanomyces invadans]|eukprot:XP_008875448.1 3,4-dihydroxy-2-butanone-4-phosphate synthase [Aphanomyces invadans]
MDNEDRENEGDLITAAEKATEESLAFMIRYSSGVVCAPLTVQRINDLQLPMMVPNNTEVRKCKFTITVDLDEGNTTGISAADRARTIRALADPNVPARAFNRPGHVFPLVSVDGGVLARAGHTEASVDLARLAGCTPAAYICEINDDNGRMLRRPQLEVFAETHNLPLITISDLIRYRFSHETVVQRLTAPTVLHTPFGDATKISFGSTFDAQRYEALVVGDVTSTGTLVHLVQGTLEGSIEAQFAHQHIVRQGKAGVLVFVPGYEGLVDVSGELMAQQSIFGMGLQILRQLGATSVVLLATIAPPFDTKGFGVDVECVEVLQKTH